MAKNTTKWIVGIVIIAVIIIGVIGRDTLGNDCTFGVFPDMDHFGSGVGMHFVIG